jgi:DNA end-binding protein Ku
LARHIVETKTGHFAPDKFEDHYEHALKELIEKKAKGEKIEVPKLEPTGKVINLMDALRRSVQAEKTTATARPAPARAGKKGRKNVAQKDLAQKEMLLPITGKKAAAHAESGKARPQSRQRKAG